jgi:excinuclease ABC subunit C
MSIVIDEQIKKIPNDPGVYRYYDAEGKLLYIGKAKNLKKRVSSYFVESKQTSSRIKLLVKRIHKIEYTIVANEKDAFLLENSLIKEYQPKYNIQLKDDKTFPYIVIVKEPFPRIYLTRNKKNDGSEYFGPYTSVKYVRQTLEMIKSIYPIRSCTLNLSPTQIAKKQYKVCLEFHLKNCLGPCDALQSLSAYMENILQVKAILKGSTAEIKQIFQNQMNDLAENLQFEAANEVKKKLKTLEQYQQRSSIVHPKLGNLHVFGFTHENDKSFIHYFEVKEGTIITTRNLILKQYLEEQEDEILDFAIRETIENFDNGIELIVPFLPSSEYEKILFTIPSIGDKKKLLQLATKNALELKQNHRYTKPLKKNEQLLTQIKEDLHLAELPFQIECFDNSNFQGSFPVASMVVFKNGKPSTKDYRHFNIKTVTGPDDFASMEEVVYRRYKRLLEEGALLPQLIVIDGGKGQLSSAYKSLKELKLADKIQIISIAKRLEELYYPNDELPYNLNKRSPTLKVLQHIRNEAHRFAITFHRNKRSSDAYNSVLENIEGIGKKTAASLMKTFKSVKRIRNASVSELATIIGNKKAELIFQYFQMHQ